MYSVHLINIPINYTIKPLTLLGSRISEIIIGEVKLNDIINKFAGSGYRTVHFCTPV